MVAFLPTSYFFDVYGLRWASVTAAFLVMVGCAIRSYALVGGNDGHWVSAADPEHTCAYLLAGHQGACTGAVSAAGIKAMDGCPISCVPKAHGQLLVWMHAGQFLNGLAGPVGMMSGPVLSAAWFPPSSRTTSTAFIAIANGVGTAGANFIGPWLVKTHDSVEEQNAGMATYMLACTIVALVTLVAMVVYFPNRPPNAPSVTATIQRTDFKQGAKDLLKHRNWWLLASAYGIMTGIGGSFYSILALNLKPIFYDADAVAAQIGFWGGLAGMGGGSKHTQSARTSASIAFF